MTSAPAPVVTFPLPVRLPEEELVQISIAILLGGHETTANQINLSLLALLSPGLRLATGMGELRFKEKMTITGLYELPVTWDA
jgi:cytochrome P450